MLSRGRVRRKVIEPLDLTVTEAAKALGIGRQGSCLLNEKAALTADMPVRTRLNDLHTRLLRNQEALRELADKADRLFRKSERLRKESQLLIQESEEIREEIRERLSRSRPSNPRNSYYPIR